MSWKACCLLGWSLAPLGGLMTYAMGGGIWLALIEVAICAAALPPFFRFISGEPM